MVNMDATELPQLATLIRYYILIATTAAGSGHPSSSLSATDLMTVLFFKYLRQDLDNFASPENDRVIFSKGHGAPLLYSLYAAAGKISEADLLKLRQFDSPLEGHPTPRFPYAEAATGSLGQGLSLGVGEALALRFRTQNSNLNDQRRENVPAEFWSLSSKFSLPHVFVLLGDGELAEGAVWEAAASASFYQLNSLIAICDVNRLGQSQETMYGHDTEVYRCRFAAFGWETILIDGHDFTQIDSAYQKALAYQKGPTVIIAKTLKGKGVSFLENQEGWHGRALPPEELAKALAELGEVDKKLQGIVEKPTVAEVANENLDVSSVSLAKSASSYPSVPSRSQSEAPQNFVGSPQPISAIPAPVYDKAKPVATRRAFGQALARLGGEYSQMVVLDGDVKNSTYTELFQKTYPARFFEMFIAEQNMVGVAAGMARRGLVPWVATFACFLTRVFDQIRMAALSGVTIKFCGSHAGVSIGEDGGSQMGLEDIAMFRAVEGSTVVYPSDAWATERLVESLMSQKGISYLRTTRMATPLVYTKDDQFPLGGAKVFAGKNEKVTVVAAGITLHEALKAQKQLAGEGIGIRVIDCYSLKPIAKATLAAAASQTQGLVVVEDHYPEGGLGEAVKSALAASPRVPIVHLAVYKTPRSGKPEELLAYEGLASSDIVETVKSLLKLK